MVDDWRATQRARRARPLLLPCVCGGPEIRAASNSHADITEGVQRHQIEPVHIAYDEAHGIPLSEAQHRARALDGGG